MTAAAGGENFTLDWDQNGQLTNNAASTTFDYNWDGQLRQADWSDDHLKLKYDPDGSRVYRESQIGSTTAKRKYIVDVAADLPVILLELDSAASNAVKKTYVYAHDQIIAQHDGDMNDFKYFYLHGRLGSVRQVIDVNADVKWLYTYGPFGKKLEANHDADDIENPFQFVGQYYDQEIEQYFLRKRQYDPLISRFTSIDPVNGNFNEPLTLHQYLYCLNDPINRSDLTGQFSVLETVMTTAKYGMRAWYAYDVYSTFMGYAEQIAAGASYRNVMFGAAIDITCSVGIVKGAGFLTKAAVPAINKVGGQLVRLAKRKGHHVIPKWAGGKWRQWLYRSMTKEQHNKLETIIRKRMHERFGNYGLRIGGKGGKYKDIWGILEDNPGMQADVFDELLDIYREFDKYEGTELVQAFWTNLAGVKWNPL